MRKTIAACVVTALAVSGTSATAASLITSAKIADGTIMNRDIHAGTISESRLNRGVVAKLNRLAERGSAGATGATGAAGATGATGANGANGAKGLAGAKGDAGAAGKDGNDGMDGRDGKDGLNPATAVKMSGDAGWMFSGAPNARLAGGELRLAGGFDGNTVAGGIGMAKSYDAPLASLSALGYSLRVVKRPNDLSAPAIHVAVTGANTGTASGFMNLVFEPYQNGGTEVGKAYTLDAYSGQWWGTRDTPNHARQQLGSLASFIADNPSAKIIAISVDNGNTSGPGTIPVADFDAGVDNLVVGFGDTFERYDFGR
jgi:collagen triple helix repeat protein